MCLDPRQAGADAFPVPAAGTGTAGNYSFGLRPQGDNAYCTPTSTLHRAVCVCVGGVCGVWCVVCGVWCVVCGERCVVCGVWCVVCGVWGVVYAWV